MIPQNIAAAMRELADIIEKGKVIDCSIDVSFDGSGVLRRRTVINVTDLIEFQRGAK